jgi:hypothetical protein
LGAEVIADLIDRHVLLQSPKGESDNSAFRYVEAGPAEEAGDAGLLEEFEEIVVEVQGGGSGWCLLPHWLDFGGFGRGCRLRPFVGFRRGGGLVIRRLDRLGWSLGRNWA